MKKKTFLKSLSFTSLALLMGAAGVFAFAPLGASPNNLANASEMLDQINTKADGENIKYAPSALGLNPENDPVIYTTESGLEIKFGGAFNYVANGGGNETTEFVSTLPSSSFLNGYPYFTMGTFNGYAVNWVIIGKSTSGIPTTKFTFDTNLTYDTLSSWQTKSSETPTYKNFFDNTYDTNTPAGNAIKNDHLLSDNTARKLTTTFEAALLNSLKANDEIPTGCVLAYSECYLGTSIYGNTHIYGNCTSGQKIIMQNMYDSTLGLTTAEKNRIQTVDLKIRHNNALTGHTVTGQKLFPLTYYGSSSAANGATNVYVENFTYHRYSINMKCYAIGTTTLGSYWFSSGMAHSSTSNSSDVVSVNTNGGGVQTARTNNYGIRPACVIKLA